VIFINGHRATFQAFSALAKQKATVEGSQFVTTSSPLSFLHPLFAPPFLTPSYSMFEALIEDVVTRWDSELELLVRLHYFDNEIISLYGIPELEIPPDIMLNRFELDLALGMTLVLEPLRIFTKEVQHRNKVTLACVPRNLDRLITQLAPGSFATRLLGRSAGVLELVETFQLSFVSSIN